MISHWIRRQLLHAFARLRGGRRTASPAPIVTARPAGRSATCEGRRCRSGGSPSPTVACAAAACAAAASAGAAWGVTAVSASSLRRGGQTLVLAEAFGGASASVAGTPASKRGREDGASAEGERGDEAAPFGLSERDFQNLIFGDGEIEAQGEIASVTNAEREQFDRLLEEILADLPDELHLLLEEVPLIVEDEPSPPMVHRLARSRGVDPRKFGRAMKRQLCGLFTGIPLTERSVNHSGMLSDEIRLFRNGILIAAGFRRAGRNGVADDAIREQIRVTLLHEIGHHFGLDEDDLAALGYA